MKVATLRIINVGSLWKTESHELYNSFRKQAGGKHVNVSWIYQVELFNDSSVFIIRFKLKLSGIFRLFRKRQIPNESNKVPHSKAL